MKLVPSWWTTNKQLRADIKKLQDDLKAAKYVASERANILRTYRNDIARLETHVSILKRNLTLAQADKAAQKVPSHIEGMRKAGSVIPARPKPPVTSSGFTKPRPDDPVKREDSSSGTTDFLTGAIIGMVANEIFSSHSSSDSSSSSSSDSGISSGGGGDFGGGGASSSWD